MTTQDDDDVAQGDAEQSRPSRLDALRERTRRRYTADDVERVVDAQAERVREGAEKAKTTISRRDVIRPMLAGVLILGSVGIAAGATSSHRGSQEALRSGRQEIDRLEATRADLPADDSLSAESDAATTVLSSATTQGQAVTDLQNQYITTSTGDTAALRGIADALAPYFDDEALSASGLDPRQPWFLSPGDATYAWTFVSDFEFVGEDVSVAWQCSRLDDNTLMAWVTARYSAKSQKFTHVARYQSASGTKNAGATMDSDPEPEVDVDPEPDTENGDGT